MPFCKVFVNPYKNTVFDDVFASRARKKRVQKAFQNRHFGVQVQPAQPILTHLGAMLAHLDASLVTCGAMLANLGAMLAILGLCWPILAPCWPSLVPMLGHLGAMLANMELCWANLALLCGLCWAIWTDLGPARATTAHILESHKML